jgi:hypothetical protein
MLRAGIFHAIGVYSSLGKRRWTRWRPFPAPPKRRQGKVETWLPREDLALCLRERLECASERLRTRWFDSFSTDMG